MANTNQNPNDLYNLRWNGFNMNLLSVFSYHQKHESLVDVTISCEGQFLRAHKLVLSASSIYFQKMFDVHKDPNMLIILNDAKFNDLQMLIEFMYSGEVKIAQSQLSSFLLLGKMLNVKGLNSVKIHGGLNQRKKSPTPPPIPTPPSIKKSSTAESPRIRVRNFSEQKAEKVVSSKKRKIDSTANNNDLVKSTKVFSKNPVRPISAFMVFANLWRSKLSLEHPSETNKQISLRLSNMWKSLSKETKDEFYEDAKRLSSNPPSTSRPAKNEIEKVRTKQQPIRSQDEKKNENLPKNIKIKEEVIDIEESVLPYD